MVKRVEKILCDYQRLLENRMEMKVVVARGININRISVRFSQLRQDYFPKRMNF